MHPPWASLLVGPISSSRASLRAGGRPSCTSRRRLEGGRAGAEQPPLATCTRGGAARELWTAAPRPFDAVGWPQPQRRSPRLKSAFGSRGVVTKTRAPFPNHSHIGLPLPAGAGRHGQADKTFIRVCVCARRMTRARRPHLAHAQKQARGERSVELTRSSGTRSAPAAPPSIQGVRAVAPPHLAACCPPVVPSSWAVHLSDITRESELIGPAGNEPRAGAAAPGGG